MCNRETGIGDNLLNNCDLFIYQKISDSFGEFLSTKYILSKLPDHCIKISFANAYFIPYYPQLTNSNNGFPYGDKNVINLLQQGLSKEEIISIISDENFYTSEELLPILDEALKDLSNRESDTDIQIVDFIKERYRYMHLFCTINHPKPHLICFLAMKMLDKLGIPNEEILHYFHDEFDSLIHPIYPSVAKHLKLSFAQQDQPHFSHLHVPLTFRQYYDKYIDYLTKGTL